MALNSTLNSMCSSNHISANTQKNNHYWNATILTSIDLLFTAFWMPQTQPFLHSWWSIWSHCAPCPHHRFPWKGFSAHNFLSTHFQPIVSLQHLAQEQHHEALKIQLKLCLQCCHSTQQTWYVHGMPIPFQAQHGPHHSLPWTQLYFHE